MSEFGNILKRLRNENKLTQIELAEKLNISKSSISMYENGNREPDFETLEIFADFFNVNLSVLLGEEKNKPTFADTEIDTIAAHALSDLTEDEQQKIIEFAKFIKSQRTNRNDKNK